MQRRTWHEHTLAVTPPKRLGDPETVEPVDPGAREWFQHRRAIARRLEGARRFAKPAIGANKNPPVPAGSPVGAVGLEPTASSPPDWRANQAALRPVPDDTVSSSIRP